MTAPIAFTILGQAASKANSRRLVTLPDGTPRSIKSAAALAFMRDARHQIPPALRVRLQGPVAVALDIYYASERPDLDESVVLDAMQDHFTITQLGQGRRRRDLVQAGVFCNDRQVRWKLVVHHIDRANPRVVVKVAPIGPTQDMFALLAPDEALPF